MRFVVFDYHNRVLRFTRDLRHPTIFFKVFSECFHKFRWSIKCLANPLIERQFGPILIYVPSWQSGGYPFPFTFVPIKRNRANPFLIGRILYEGLILGSVGKFFRHHLVPLSLYNS